VSSREIVTLQIGRAGNVVGNAFWDRIHSEHHIDKTSGEFRGGPDSRFLLDNASVFLDEDRNGKYWPRVLCCDLNLDEMTSVLGVGGDLPRMYPSRCVIGSNAGSGNCYGRAFHTEGLGVAQQTMSRFRRGIEGCDSLQGVQFLHALSGGTGSGLCGLLMQSIHDYLNAGSKCMLYSACIAPSPSHSDIVLEPYNTALVLHDMAEYCHLVIPFDNDAMSKFRKSSCPQIMARAMADLTSSQRFPGLLRGDLRKLHSNTVPYKNGHFLTTSISSNDDSSVLSLTQDVLTECTTLSIDQQIPGISRYLACFLAYRGRSVSPSEVDGAISGMLRSGSPFDPFLPDWIPNCLSASISTEGTTNSVTCFANNTAISQFFDRVITNFDTRFQSRSHVYLYEENGVHVQEMLEARNLVQTISDQYKQYGMYEDKILLEGPQRVNPRAVLSNEQQVIADELLRLG
jgi:tubulin beta